MNIQLQSTSLFNKKTNGPCLFLSMGIVLAFELEINGP